LAGGLLEVRLTFKLGATMSEEGNEEGDQVRIMRPNITQNNRTLYGESEKSLDALLLQASARD
jgi:hypothetical protein